MAPLRGWCARGRRLKDHVPYGRWQTLTFLAALRHDTLTAPCLFDGPINGESFRLYVEQILVPTLKPGDIVVMDNLGSHKSQAVLNWCRFCPISPTLTDRSTLPAGRRPADIMRTVGSSRPARPFGGALYPAEVFVVTLRHRARNESVQATDTLVHMTRRRRPCCGTSQTCPLSRQLTDKC